MTAADDLCVTAGAGAEQQARQTAGRLERARAELLQLEDQVADKRAEIVRLEARHHRWSAGEAGERAVGDVLDALLTDGWQVLHDVRWPGRQRANLDHVAVGPGGVVVVDAKNWTSDVTVRGGVLRAGRYRKDDAIESALDQGAAVASLLPAPYRSSASSVVCFVGQSMEVHSLRGVAVLSLTELADHLRELPQALSALEVAALAAQLRHDLDPSGGRLPRPRVRTVGERRTRSRSVTPSPSAAPGSVRRLVRGALLLAAAVVLAGTSPAWVPDVVELLTSRS